jgi:hypothetical protein
MRPCVLELLGMTDWLMGISSPTVVSEATCARELSCFHMAFLPHSSHPSEGDGQGHDVLPAMDQSDMTPTDHPRHGRPSATCPSCPLEKEKRPSCPLEKEERAVATRLLSAPSITAA